jgi:hypothetical protein
VPGARYAFERPELGGDPRLEPRVPHEPVQAVAVRVLLRLLNNLHQFQFGFEFDHEKLRS